MSERIWQGGRARPATLAFVGDVVLTRGLDGEMARRPPESFWGSVLPLLRSADAVIANLECAITEHTQPWQKTPKVFYLRADPSAIDVLRAANIRCVSLANNHTLDFGEEGLEDTLRHLDAAGIRHAGAGAGLAQAAEPAVIDAAGLRVGIVSFTDNEPPFAAGPDQPGTNYLEIAADPPVVARVEQAAARARQRAAELVVLSLHWGPNMRRRPSPEFRAFARAALDHSVNLVHGHSAHLFQGVERYRRGLVLYDTGNILDDFPVDPDFRKDWSFVFLVEADAAGLHRLRLVPVRLGYGRVDLATGAEFDAIVERMRSLCAALGTPVGRVRPRDDDRANLPARPRGRGPGRPRPALPGRLPRRQPSHRFANGERQETVIEEDPRPARLTSAEWGLIAYAAAMILVALAWLWPTVWAIVWGSEEWEPGPEQPKPPGLVEPAPGNPAGPQAAPLID
jgi:poly-gamma-glutamate synthesis protein (capsule biosynthesis protein)